jgi:hypothetical protein
MSWLPRIIPLSLLLSTAVHAAPGVVTAAEWAQPRSGHALSSHPAIAGAVRRLLELPEGRLVVRYPGGDEGGLWARELASWLVALGVAGDRIDLFPGAERTDALELDVVGR